VSDQYQQQPQQPAHKTSDEAASARMRRRADLIEELLEDARARGEFENLKGAGQPLDLQKDLYAGDKALAYSLLRSNQMAPPEIERGKEIDADLARAADLLMRLRHQRAALAPRAGARHAAERRAYNLLRDKTEARYTEALRAINSKILSLNIVAPSALHRRTIDVEARLREFADEFPRLPE
jgi:hypothetical protein